MVEMPARALPVVSEADVVVVGGGTAGFVAAIAAARTGAHTVLVERYGYLGGCLTGTYNTNPGRFGDLSGHQVIKGIGWEYVERMERAGAAIVNRDRWAVQTFPETSKMVALEMAVEASVELYLHSWASEATIEEDMIQGIVIQAKSGREVITGTAFVDATGDADLAYLAGAPTEQLDAENTWQTSVDLTVCNVDATQVIQWLKDHPERTGWTGTPMDEDVSGVHPMVTFLVRGEGTETDKRGGVVHVGPVPTVKLMVHRSVSRVQGSVEIDGTDVRALTTAEVEARKRAMAHLAYLRETIPGYEDAIVVGASPLGVRETRRIVGEYVLTLDDLLGNARFADVVALNCRALDRHLKGEVFKYDLFEGNHDIPLRALLPQKVGNLTVAGRCVSSDHEANASLRGAGTCMATGHAAGMTAALAAKASGRVRDLDVGVLQQTLREQEVILSTE
jgi:hypothetical protein